jgi:hypothetical protein
MEKFLEVHIMTDDEMKDVLWLERENARLQRLVAELLIKNEELRRACSVCCTESDP